MSKNPLVELHERLVETREQVLRVTESAVKNRELMERVLVVLDKNQKRLQVLEELILKPKGIEYVENDKERNRP